jgi:hypothetical protein
MGRCRADSDVCGGVASRAAGLGMGIWQGVAMDFLKFQPGPPCPTLLRLVAGPPLHIKVFTFDGYYERLLYLLGG